MYSVPTQPKQLCHPPLRPHVRKTGETNHTTTNAFWGVRDTGLPNVHVAFPFVLSRDQEETESNQSGPPRKRNGLTTRKTAYQRGEKVKKNFCDAHTHAQRKDGITKQNWKWTTTESTPET